VLFQCFVPLDAGSVIPDLIRDRHDGQKLGVSLDYDPVWQAGVQFKPAWIPAPVCTGAGSARE